MSNKRITSTRGDNGERVHKGLLSAVQRIEKLKPKALDALTRKIVKKEEKEFAYQQFLPKGVTNNRKIFRFVTRLLKDKTYNHLGLPVHHNYTWNTEDILDVVLEATIRNSCIEDASNSLNLRKPKITGKSGIEMESTPNGDTVLRRGRLKILSASTCKPKDLNPWMYTCLCEKEKKEIQGQGPSEVDGPCKTLGFYPYQLFG